MDLTHTHTHTHTHTPVPEGQSTPIYVQSTAIYGHSTPIYVQSTAIYGCLIYHKIDGELVNFGGVTLSVPKKKKQILRS